MVSTQCFSFALILSHNHIGNHHLSRSRDRRHLPLVRWRKNAMNTWRRDKRIEDMYKTKKTNWNFWYPFNDLSIFPIRSRNPSSFSKSRRVSVQFPHFRWPMSKWPCFLNLGSMFAKNGLVDLIFVCYPLLKPETNSFAHENRAETQKRWQNLPFGPIFQGRAGGFRKCISCGKSKSWSLHTFVVFKKDWTFVTPICGVQIAFSLLLFFRIQQPFSLKTCSNML